MSPLRWAIYLASLCALAAGAPYAGTGELHRPYERMVSMERDLRADAESFARQAGFTPHEFQSRFGASGLVRCGKAVGSGQITLAGDVISTAAHVFFAPGGRLRNETCTFELAHAPEAPIKIDMNSIISGSPKPMEERATLDWAVARLSTKMEKIAPYAVAGAPSLPSPITMYGGGNGPAAQMGVEQCAARRITAVAPEGIREIAFDCSAAHGGSGAALLNDRGEMVGIFVGFRSTNAAASMPFSDIHYNFAISVEGPFRRALLQAAGK
jgi:hypothetical protein